MGLISWFRHYKIDLHTPELFTGRVYIPVEQRGIEKAVVVRTKRNGGVSK